jgi:hypothetical protein
MDMKIRLRYYGHLPSDSPQGREASFVTYPHGGSASDSESAESIASSSCL